MQISLSEFVTLLHGKPLESWQSKLLNEYEASAAPIGYAQGDDHMLTAAALRDEKADEQVAAKEKAEEQAKQKADLEKDVAKVEAAAKNEGKSTAGTATQAADTQTTAAAADTATDAAQTSYDYHKDVAPVLTKVAKKSRDLLVNLLGEYGVVKGDKIPPAKYSEVLAKCHKLIAG